jgi:hypothetical protein
LTKRDLKKKYGPRRLGGSSQGRSPRREFVLQ